MKILLAGATGVVGRPLLAQLLDAGHEVVCITRSKERARSLVSAGASAVTGDLFEREFVLRVVEDAGPGVVVDQTTDLPQRAGITRIGLRRFYQGQIKLEQQGKPALLRAAVAAGVRRYVMQSIGFMYAPNGPEPRTEQDPVFEAAPRPWRDVVPPLLDLEDQVTNSSTLQGVVLRYGYFYGPGTYFWPGGQFYEQVKHRRFPIVGSGSGFWPFVHVEDAAAAAVAAIERGEPGVYNIVDDDPAPMATWLPTYASLIGAKPPLRVPAIIARLGSGPLPVHWATRQPPVSNTKARSVLGWRPRYPSWREGLGESTR